MTQAKRRTVVSLFSGAGGLDAGLEMAGFETVSAVDVDEDCAATLRATQEARVVIPGQSRTFLEGSKIICSSVSEISGSELRPRGAPSRWRPDVLVGGPPCQPFSSAGKQGGLADPRGRLFEDFVRLADELEPRFILFENVRGLVTARGPRERPGEVLELVKRRFEEIGYGTTFAVLNAADFGAPQRRVRLFMIGCRNGSPPAFPAATHGEEGGPLTGVAPWLSLADFLSAEDIKNDEADIIRPSDRLQSLLAELPNGRGLKSAGARETTRPGGHWGYKQGTFIVDPALPARTVTAAATQDWLREPDGTLRRLTWRECARLQGFDPDWRFVGDRASVYRQIGNAVPATFGLVLGKVLQCALDAYDHRAAPQSAPLPKQIVSAIEYTSREHLRNGASRLKVRAALRDGSNAKDLKGTGTGRGRSAKSSEQLSFG